jgi:hypothetical protein
MKTIQFEAVKVALKQNKDGFILTLCLHPDDAPDDLLRDFVGARYQVVMVRLNEEEQPLDRQEFDGAKAVRLAGVLCRDPEFWAYLEDEALVFEPNESEATEWLRGYLSVDSRSELKTNNQARELLNRVNKDFMSWKQKNG